jgi:fucose permease
MFAFGMVLALPGTVAGLPDAAERFDLTFASRGLLISTMFLGLLVGSFLSGPIVDALGHRRALAGSALLIAISLPLFAVATGFAWAAAALAAVGLACAGVNTAANAMSSDLFPEERGRRMNGLAIAVGLGGLTLPAATALTAAFVPWWWVVSAGAVLAAAVGVTAATGRVAAEHPHAGPARAAIAGVLRQPGLVWIGLLVMLGAGSEASMAGFTSTYLTAVGFDAATATLVLSSHWIGLIVGRVLFGGRVDRGKDRAIVRAAAISAVMVLALVLASAEAVLVAMPFAVGVTMAIIMPTALALGGERYPRNAGTLFGLLLTVAQAGAMVLPAAIGVVAEAAGVRAGMGLLVATNLLIVGVCVRASRAAGRVYS